LIEFDMGDRWQVERDEPRKDGVRLSFMIMPERSSIDGKPTTIGMEATESSTLESAFGNEGGSIRFADLAPQSGPGFTGESTDLAGTIEWMCGGAGGRDVTLGTPNLYQCQE